MKIPDIQETTCFYDAGNYYPIKVKKSKKGLVIDVEKTVQTIHIEIQKNSLKGTYTILPLEGGRKIGPFSLTLEVKKQGEVILTASPEEFVKSTRWILARTEQAIRQYLAEEGEKNLP